MTNIHAEKISQADKLLSNVLGMAWSSTSTDIGAVIAQTVRLNATAGRITKEIRTFLPRTSPPAHAEALEWAAQRQQEASQALQAVLEDHFGEERTEPTVGPLKLSTGGTLTPGPAKVVLTLDMLQELARARFGSDPKRWRFVCPACLSETAVGDFAEIAPNGAPGQECIGRYFGESECNHAAYGLIPLAPWIVITPEGKHVLHFALADADPVPESDPDLDSNAGQEVPHEGKTASDVAGS